jgi:Lon protease-like protein
MDLPLFPLHTVLCPGVALPLHVFEDRYKAMVERCLADRAPFGVVLIREGREVGPGDLAIAAVGTVAEIREATRYRDGRFDLMTLGTYRFRLEGVDPGTAPYLVGQATPLGEVLGEAAHAKALGERVVQLFIRYLEILQVEEGTGGRSRARPTDGAGRTFDDEQPGEPWAIDPDDLADAYAELQADAEGGDAEPDPGPAPEAADEDRAAMLDEAARKLTIPDDPTVLSYLLSGIVQVESIRRQGLLESPTTELRLAELAHLLEREIALLERGLSTYAPDPRLAHLRRN